jgi:tRNA(Leu) C34 or U34 (ribose-2'-O)-methylase TrmL
LTNPASPQTVLLIIRKCCLNFLSHVFDALNQAWPTQMVTRATLKTRSLVAGHSYTHVCKILKKTQHE